MAGSSGSELSLVTIRVAMTTPAVEDHRIIDDPWPTLDDALEAARFIAEQAQNLYGDLLESVWLYGSRARGDHRPDSDLDLLLVTTSKEADPSDRLCRKLHEKLMMEHFEGRMWGYLSLHSAHSEQLREWDTMFYRNVRADAVRVR